MCEMCGCGSTEFMAVSLKAPSASDMSQQGVAGTTDKMEHTAEETSRFGMGDN
jgi:hypothetical protein